ncbi:aminoglycoside phosphotransferase (APT) family kinase protein [Streptomyces achromogenes]|uniref:Aminoglycoside phosphotransferase (APT) family kinase protein n=1 Tax=Streptomyces achromogenes TaxID=67255 RepID=A0ABU0PZU5_STRAH|nr:phosphotransferase [Streptomyces achromogenes]MDQ0683456.1 aminoglycoside phosphotransferase (APT) family kinase protein [Streptomyces achromogenes]
MLVSTMGRLLGSGRTADVYEIDEAWVLRRDREGRGDAVAEAAVMAHVRAHGYPAPAVRPPVSRADLVMERLDGPTMLQALTAGALDAGEAGEMLARLLRALHAVPGRVSGGARVLHLDLHPDNVILAPDGPRVIDWTNAQEGGPGLDWGTSAVILAQVAVSAEPVAAPALPPLARAMLTALLADPSDLTEEGLAQALRRRAANPTMSPQETELLPPAAELIRSLTE